MDSIVLISVITGLLFAPFSTVLDKEVPSPREITINNCTAYLNKNGSGALSCLKDTRFDICSATTQTLAMLAKDENYPDEIRLPDLTNKTCERLTSTLSLKEVQEQFPESTYCALDNSPTDNTPFTQGSIQAPINLRTDRWAYVETKARLEKPTTYPLVAQTQSCNVVWH